MRVLAIAATLVLLSLQAELAEARPSSKPRRIGVLSAFAGPLSAQGELGRALGELGYVEGQDLVFEARYAKGRYDRLPDLALELVTLKVDAIVTMGTIAAQAAQRATRTIPVVFTITADPIGSGLVASLARPGANITGVSLMAADINAKRLELLKEAVPAVSRVGILWSRFAPVNRALLVGVDRAARALQVQVHPLEIHNPSELERAFAAIARARADALYVLSDPMLLDQRTRIAQLASRNRLPAISGLRDFSEAGGLMSYGASLSDSFRRAATQVDRILKGARPADLPVEQPTRFELVVNLRTAKALALTIPQSFLLRADGIIQ